MTQELTLLQQISDVAWLVRQGNQRIGILNKDVQDRYTYITGKELLTFTDKNQVTEHFGNIKLFEEQVEEPIKQGEEIYIQGHRVEYPDAHVIERGHPAWRPDLPLFTKLADSDVVYAAGYYCIKFESGWKHAHECKLSTLLKYGYEGPFRTQFDMKQRLRELNRQ